VAENPSTRDKPNQAGDEVEKKYAIDLETAKRVATAAQREADNRGRDAVLMLVDGGGHLMYLQREKAQLGGNLVRLFCRAWTI
jgi:uncharacterized protein GlcG (DUF336 family)